MTDLTSSVPNRLPVLVGVDGSESSNSAVRWAADEAGQLDAPLRILHAWMWPLYHVRLGPPPGAPPGAGLRAQAERVLSQAAKVAQAAAPGSPVETSLVTGASAVELVRAAAQARMLVVGHRGLGGFSGLLLGSVGVTVSAHSPCPVVVVRGDPHPGGQVVVGVDGSPGSRLALVTAFGEAARRGACLLAVHAWAMPLRAEDGSGDYEGELERGEREGRQLAARETLAVSKGFPDVVFDVAVGDRSAGAELVAASAGAQLVVVGSRGVGGLKGLLLGSTAHALLHHAACPVFVARD
jgi:nucleotide-binding universal stress UspA family protein